MDAVARLLAIAEIERLKAKYFYALDHCDWDMMRREVFTETATLSFPEAEPFADPEAFIAFLTASLADKVTVHHGHTPIIAVTGETSATGIWAMVDHIWGRPQPPGSHDPSWMIGHGHYHEDYVRLDSGWRIAKLRLTRLRVELAQVFEPERAHG